MLVENIILMKGGRIIQNHTKKDISKSGQVIATEIITTSSSQDCLEPLLN